MKLSFVLPFSLGFLFLQFVLNQAQNELDELWKISSTTHPSHIKATTFLQRINETYPDLAKLYSLGKSVEGRDLWVMQMTKDVTKDRPLLKPMVKIVANIHGNEVLGRSLILMLIVDILKKYLSKDQRLTTLLENTDIHLAPSLNPDGFERASTANCGGGNTTEDLGGMGRSNAKSVDLNRDFPDQYKDNVNDQSTLWNGKRQPETEIIMKWILQQPFVLSCNMHGGSLVVSYPFDDAPSCFRELNFYNNEGLPNYTPDNEFFVQISKGFALKHKTMLTTACPNDFAEFLDGITNGANLYTVTGGMQDFNYMFSNCMEITVQLSCCKYPLAADLQKEWENNEEAFYYFLESVHRGIKGTVKDKNGAPIKAAMVYAGPISRGVATTSTGEYWKLVVGGKYSVTVKYQDCEVSIANVEVSNDTVTILDFKLSCVQVSAGLPMPCSQILYILLVASILYISHY